MPAKHRKDATLKEQHGALSPRLLELSFLEEAKCAEEGLLLKVVNSTSLAFWQCFLSSVASSLTGFQSSSNPAKEADLLREAFLDEARHIEMISMHHERLPKKRFSWMLLRSALWALEESFWRSLATRIRKGAPIAEVSLEDVTVIGEVVQEWRPSDTSDCKLVVLRNDSKMGEIHLNDNGSYAVVTKQPSGLCQRKRTSSLQGALSYLLHSG